METWLRQAGAQVTPAGLGLSVSEVKLGLRSAHYLRDRFTLNKLGYIAGLPLPAVP